MTWPEVQRLLGLATASLAAAVGQGRRSRPLAPCLAAEGPNQCFKHHFRFPKNRLKYFSIDF